MKIKIITIIAILVMFFFGFMVSAKSITEGLDETAKTANLLPEGSEGAYGQVLVQNKIGDIIKAILSMVGVIFFVLVLYGGLTWMLAGGDSDKVSTGRNYIIYAALGLGLIALSYGIANYVINLLGSQTMK